MPDTMTLYFLGWTVIGSVGCWLTAFGLNRVFKRSREWCATVGAVSWAFASSAAIYAFYCVKSADLAAHHRMNVGFLVVMLAVWFAFSFLGTVFGALLATLSSAVGRR
ncbi:hypothetical protein [Sphingomonas glacialis]|uniref:Uncharacterized protein n=1 Tax=Sphingomonas glacialis TaxID=658225 RepID=A0A502FY53_9SPHN|nr:hypothetical protein [Sphingomonas glacialis]TPG54341.1 hypothetical protein EAH76_06615 [Sphingomonas glacialis]